MMGKKFFWEGGRHLFLSSTHVLTHIHILFYTINYQIVVNSQRQVLPGQGVSIDTISTHSRKPTMAVSRK